MIRSVFKPTRSLAAAGALLALLGTAPAAAAPLKVWVAYYGIDSPTCGDINTPCLGLQQAHNNVMPGGDVSVLTPIDFGLLLNITKSVNITNDGVGEASILMTAGNPTGQAILVNAGRGDVVSLRGLVVDGQIRGPTGIQIQQASAVHIQNCVIRNFEASGSAWGISLVAGNPIQLFVSDTIIYNNGSMLGTAGIVISPIGGSGSIRVVLDRVHVENNVIGIGMAGGTSPTTSLHVLIRDSVVSGNASDGISAFTGPGLGPILAVVERTSVMGNGGIGIHADGPHAVILLDDNTITQNGEGVGAGVGAQLISYGNNRNNNNVGDEGFVTGTFAPM